MRVFDASNDFESAILCNDQLCFLDRNPIHMFSHINITVFNTGTAVMSGIYTLVVLALERFYVIVRPFHNRILDSPKRIAICIGVIWIISACLQVRTILYIDRFNAKMSRS